MGEDETRMASAVDIEVVEGLRKDKASHTVEYWEGNQRQRWEAQMEAPQGWQICGLVVARLAKDVEISRQGGQERGRSGLFERVHCSASQRSPQGGIWLHPEQILYKNLQKAQNWIETRFVSHSQELWDVLKEYICMRQNTHSILFALNTIGKWVSHKSCDYKISHS